jgi:sugar (pentulose or hexulose) kinase
MSDLLLGIDVGTTNCKAAVVDAAGAERAHGRAPTPWRQVPTGAEAEPEALFEAALAAARAALSGGPDGRVVALGVTSMAETGALLDGRGRPLAPAIAWHDERGAEEAERIAVELGERHFVESTGLPASPLCTLAKLSWLLERHPAARAAARWLNMSEWVVRRLGGRDAAELSLASRTGLLELPSRTPFAEALAWAGLPSGLIGELVVAGTPLGRVGRDALPEAEGAVLTVAGHDHLCAGVGAGVVGPGDVLDSCGTAEALVRVVAPPLDAAAVRRSVAGGVTVGWHVSEGRQALLGAVWTGLALGEVLDALGIDRAARDELDARAVAGAGTARIQLDFDSFHRSAARLPDGASPAEVWRGATRSAAARIESVLAHIEAVAGPRSRLVLSGGWAQSEALLAAKERLGPLERPPVVEAGARGAALTGGVAAGLFESIDALPPIPTAVPAGRS